MSPPTPRVVLVDGVPMSGLLAEASGAAAVIVALHGGATTSAYFDCRGAYERGWENGPAALEEVGALCTAAPRVARYEQAGAGHNLSLGHAATAYHLSALAFLEECLLFCSTTQFTVEAS